MKIQGSNIKSFFSLKRIQFVLGISLLLVCILTFMNAPKVLVFSILFIGIVAWIYGITLMTKLKAEIEEEFTIYSTSNENIRQSEKEEVNKKEADLHDSRMKKIDVLITEEGKNIVKLFEKFTTHVSKELDAVQGALFITKKKDPKNILQYVSGYSFQPLKGNKIEMEFGEGITGQVAIDKKTLVLSDLPEAYRTIFSGLGSSTPRYLVVCPIIHNDDVIGIIELSSFKQYNNRDIEYLEKGAELFAKAISAKLAILS